MRRTVIFYDALGRDRDWEEMLAQIVDYQRGEKVDDPRCYDFFATPGYLKKLARERLAGSGEGGR